MSTAVAKRDPVQEICQTIKKDEFQAQLAQALPRGVSLERFTRVSLVAVQQNPDLVKGDKASLFMALVRCAQDGLLPDGREAALVLFGQKAAYLPMVGGLRKKAAEHGFSLTAQVVREHDEFDYQLGLDVTLAHRLPKLGTPRGEVIGAYAVAKHPEHGVFVEVMSKEEIEEVRAVSRAKGGDLWTKWYGEAARKTVARRLWKQLPLGAISEDAARVIDQADVEYATAPVAELAGLDTVDVSEPLAGEVVDEADGVEFGS